MQMVREEVILLSGGKKQKTHLVEHLVYQHGV